MHSPKLTIVMVVAIGTGFALVTQVLAGGAYRNRGRAPVTCGIPRHHYAEDVPVRGGAIIAIARPEPPPAVKLYARTGLEQTVERKTFDFPVTALVVDHIVLDRVGLDLFQNGQMVCTGTLRHSGGPLGNLVGNNVTIRLRAFAGVKLNEGIPPQSPLHNAAMLWESERTLWLPRDRTMAISLLPTQQCGPNRDGHTRVELRSELPGQHALTETVRRNFDQLTHLEVVLEYTLDR